MTAARFGVADVAAVTQGPAQYEVVTDDDAGNESEPTPVVGVDPAESGPPAPTNLTVAQGSANGPVHISWDAESGADGYAVYRALEYPDSLVSPGRGYIKARPELLAEVSGAVTDRSPWFSTSTYPAFDLA